VLTAFAKPNVAIPLGVRLSVFFPHQLQCQMTMLLQLLIDGIPIRLWPLSHRPARAGSKQFGFQFFFVQAFRRRPTDPGCNYPFQILVDRTQPHSATACNLALP
jgi:hypothetical protein